jgi:asparagine synthase (glutamine-hydrolysing)
MGNALHIGHEIVREQWIDNKSGVGLGRESLGIFNADPQPVFNSTGTLASFMEGKLYNTRPLIDLLTRNNYPIEPRTDAELALFLYEQEGPKAFARLNGIFAITIWDTQRHKLTLVNDRFGLRPLYYIQMPGKFAFAGEIKGLLALNWVGRVIDESAMADFLAFNCVLGDKTPLSSVFLLPAATVMTISDGKITKNNYWSLEYAPDPPARSEEDWVDGMVDHLTLAVERRMHGSENIGLPLSCGLDSSTLLAVTTSRLGASIPTYTFGRPNSRDMQRAQRLAKVAKVSHAPLFLSVDYPSRLAERTIERADGLLNCLSSHGFALREMADRCEVMMLGNGGGAFFECIRTYYPELQSIEGDPEIAYFNAMSEIFREDELACLLTEDLFSRIKGSAFASLKDDLDKLKPNSLDNILDANCLREDERRGVLQGLSTVNHFMEYIEPYYDYDLVDFILTVPVHLRWDRRIQKMVLTRLSPSLAKAFMEPLEPSYSLKKMWLRGNRKLRRMLSDLNLVAPMNSHPQSSTFTDAHSLLRGPNRAWVEKILLDPLTLERGYFKPSSLRQLVQDHMNRIRNIGPQLSVLITLELWFRYFED